MKVFVAGSTGVLGRRLVSRLVDRGHDVVGLVRDETGAEAVRERGGIPRRGDVLERDSVVDAAEAVDVVIHAATAVPTGTNPADEAWERNDRVRIDGTRNLLAAANEWSADRFLLQSVTWVARQPDGSRFDERSTPNPDRTTASALKAERLLQSQRDDHGLGTCTLRCGWFYAHDSAQTREFGERLLDRRLPIVGNGLLGRGDARLSYLHVDDAADAFAVVVDGEATGVYHVVDDEPTTFATFLRAFAEKLDAPQPRRIPGWLARRFIGRHSVRFLTSGAPTSNDRFRDAFDWNPSVPTYREGLDQVVDRWLDDGTVRPTADGYRWMGSPRGTET